MWESERQGAPPASSQPGQAVWDQVPHRPGAILGAILALAAGLRFALLGQNSVYVDETFLVRVTQAGWQQIAPVLRAFDAHPPLYYLLMKAWVAVAGTGEAAIRAPSAAFSVVSVALAYALMRRFFAERVCLLGAFLMSISPYQVMVGQIARMYPLLEMLALASTLALSVSAARGGPLRWALYAGLGALMGYTHYLGLLVLASHGVWIACCERRHLGAWLVSAGAVALLYMPWAPSLWSQITHGQGWPWYRAGEDAAVLKFGDLLGLFAFGGSLFGMAGYFTSSTLSPIERVIVLLPFLVILWSGVRSLASDRRALAFFGLPPAVTVGVMLVVSVARPMFDTRWFSFLYPFYAIFLACGIQAAAAGVRSGQRVAAVLLTAGLVLYSVPVLDRYYFDPGARPYQWRAAASLVSQHARPGDLLLYANNSARSAFTYYFRGPGPWLVLPPGGPPPGADRERPLTGDGARQLARRYRRVWLIVTPPLDEGLPAQLQALERAFRLVRRLDFNLVWIDILEPRPG